MRNIIVAEAQGFCWGVRRALEIVDRYDAVSILGDLIHNKQVVDNLEKNNKKVIYEVTGEEQTPIVITAHGIEEQNIERLKASDTELVDTTCPLVSVIYRAGKQLEKEGYRILIIGDRKHIEVKGIASRMHDPIVVNNEEELSEVELPEKVGVICQSTFSNNKFERLIDQLKNRVEDLKVKNTICSPTKKRQIAAEELAQQVDLMIVIGGYHSSNTKKLAELTSQYVTSYHIETPDHIDQSWFIDKKEIGIIAGASTPDWIINDVYKAIEKLE